MGTTADGENWVTSRQCVRVELNVEDGDCARSVVDRSMIWIVHTRAKFTFTLALQLLVAAVGAHSACLTHTQSYGTF